MLPKPFGIGFWFAFPWEREYSSRRPVALNAAPNLLECPAEVQFSFCILSFSNCGIVYFAENEVMKNNLSHFSLDPPSEL